MLFFANLFFIDSNNYTYGQSKIFFNPQNTTIAIISEPEGFTQINISGEILKGILAIKKEFPISVILLTPSSYDEVQMQFQKAIENKANIIIANGEKIRDGFIDFAIKNPDTFFIGVDMFSNDIDMEYFLQHPVPRNLNFLLYKEEEAGFLAGIFASLLTKDYHSISNRLNSDNVVGIITAKKNDSKNRYEFGFRLGVLAINNQCVILNTQIEDESDFYLIRKNTTELYKNKADIVFQLCGKGSPAAIQAAFLGGNFIIGYESDQNIYAPENVITSAIKKVSSSVYYYLKKSFLFGFISGILRLGIKDGAVGLASFHEFDLLIPDQIKNAIYTASTSIAEDKINIPFVSLTLKDDEQAEELLSNNETNNENNQESNTTTNTSDSNQQTNTEEQTSEN